MKRRNNSGSWKVFVGGECIGVSWGNNYSRAFNIHLGTFHRISQYIDNEEQIIRLFTHTGAKKLAPKHLLKEVASRPQGIKGNQDAE